MAEYHLAAAVSEAGGLGVISAAGLFSDALRRQIRKVRELTTQPVGVHIPMSHRCVEEIAELVMEEGVRIFYFYNFRGQLPPKPHKSGFSSKPPLRPESARLQSLWR